MAVQLKFHSTKQHAIIKLSGNGHFSKVITLKFYFIFLHFLRKQTDNQEKSKCNSKNPNPNIFYKQKRLNKKKVTDLRFVWTGNTKN